jgi:hypothetical protein
MGSNRPLAPDTHHFCRATCPTARFVPMRITSRTRWLQQEILPRVHAGQPYPLAPEPALDALRRPGSCWCCRTCACSRGLEAVGHGLIDTPGGEVLPTVSVQIGKRHMPRTAIDVGAAETPAAVRLAADTEVMQMHLAPSEHDLPRGMGVARHTSRRMRRRRQISGLLPCTTSHPKRPTSGGAPVLYPPARSARGIRVPGVFMRKR